MGATYTNAAGWYSLAMDEISTTALEEPALPAPLRDRILERLGLSRLPSPDFEGLCELYGAWCARVSFDNVRKVVALQTGRDLPGRTAEEFFEAWLDLGAAGTCWPGSNALYALVRSAGFDVRRSAGSARDLGPINHATNRVVIDGRTWLVDSSMLTVDPLPLTDRVHIGSGHFAAEVEPEAGSHLVWVDFPPQGPLPFRLLPDPISLSFHLDGYERSREKSAFNRKLYARRNYPGEKRILVGNRRVSKTAAGMDVRELTREELPEALMADIGVDSRLVDEWISCGGLDLAFEESPSPPPLDRKPPSQRG